MSAALTWFIQASTSFELNAYRLHLTPAVGSLGGVTSSAISHYNLAALVAPGLSEELGAD